ncbi:kinetochore-associated protein NSL1 homolog [Mastacembelus armatus]|uniref:NSL1 component of MIS12 kinetochore complex n=1 Tax=Mastacembelus armatus TaxID=205130 RepID=A0A7N8WUY8_9TELE|nr:kinetochore-associated protein NSL1 homolog [Mastacembelus armatus]
MESVCEPNQEYRVQVTSKKQVTEQINKYKDVLKTALDGQLDVTAETKEVLVQELLTSFETAVQANVLVNGQPWDEAPDVEEDETDLEILLDDTIVETTRLRSTCPRQILPHVVHTLKAERKLKGLYELAVKPQEVVKDPDQENIMNELTAAAPGMVKHAIQVIKSINTLQKQAEGLREILNTKPSLTTTEIHRDLFSCIDQSDAPLPHIGAAMTHRQPIQRALEKAATNCYVPLAKKPRHPVEEVKPE